MVSAIKSKLSMAPAPYREEASLTLTPEDSTTTPNIWKNCVMGKLVEVVSKNLPHHLPQDLCLIVAGYIDGYINNVPSIDLDELGYQKSLAPFLDKIDGIRVALNARCRLVFGRNDAMYFYRKLSITPSKASSGYHLMTDRAPIFPLASIEFSNVEKGLAILCTDATIKRGIGCFGNKDLLFGQSSESYSMVAAAFPEGTLIKMEKEDSNNRGSWELVASAEWHLDRDLEVTTPNDGESTPTLQVSGKRKRDPETSTQSVSTVTSSSVSTTQERLSTKRPK